VNVASRVKVARQATDTLTQELGQLGPSEWETPRACGDWTVAEVVAHLAGAAERYALYIRRALEGIAEPPDGASFVTDRPTYSESIKQRAVQARRDFGEDLLGPFAAKGLALVELFESLQPGDWERPTFHAAGVLPAEGLLSWRIAELNLHRWDILNALGREPHLLGDSLEPLVDWLPSWLRAVFIPGEVLGRSVRYRIELGPPLSSVVGLELHGDRFDLDHTAGGPADAVLSADPEIFILVATGRLKWLSSIDSGALAVAGDRQAASELARRFGTI
jgi:uncharacterized protein (TIGR03083 family)